MHSVAAILLAAGLSRRMGARNKLLLPIDGKPMVRHVAETYLKAIDGPLTIVTGFEAAKICDACADLTVTYAHNEDFADGQPGSVAAGLSRAPKAELLLIGLADQPRLSVQDLSDLIAAHRAGHADKVTIPMHDDTRGNPILVPDVLRHRLTANPDRPGCMRFTRDHPEHVQFAALNAAGFYADVDTLDDYATVVPVGMEAPT